MADLSQHTVILQAVDPVAKSATVTVDGTEVVIRGISDGLTSDQLLAFIKKYISDLLDAGSLTFPDMSSAIGKPIT